MRSSILAVCAAILVSPLAAPAQTKTPAVPTVTAPAAPTAPAKPDAAAAVDKKAVADKACVIKGNVNDTGEKIYHTVESPQYGRIKIDESTGDKCFKTEKEALAAGFRASKTKAFEKKS